MKYLVTGGNGHVGNQLVRTLAAQGKDVRVSVRNVKDKRPFEGVQCEVVYADIFDIDSLHSALESVDVVIHCAAIFKHWSRDPQKDIIDANIKGTENMLEAISQRKIKKLIYLSSMMAIDGYSDILNEKTWSSRYPNPYAQAKKESEERAWELAEKWDIPMLSILPSSIAGPHWSRDHLTPTLAVLDKLSQAKVPFDPQVVLSFVHVQDIVDGIVSSVTKGCVGERYFLANEKTISSTEILKIAKSIDSSVKIPGKGPKWIQLILASIDEFRSLITNRQPVILRGNINYYFKASRKFDISKARKELNYSPREPEAIIRESFSFLSDSRGEK